MESEIRLLSKEGFHFPSGGGGRGMWAELCWGITNSEVLFNVFCYMGWTDDINRCNIGCN